MQMSNGGHGVIVEIDRETGFVWIEKVYAAEGCGVMINPMIVDGQLRGGLAQAVGMMLYEEIVHDDEGRAAGAILNAVNDALAPLGVFVDQTPITPERVLEAISSAKAGAAA